MLGSLGLRRKFVLVTLTIFALVSLAAFIALRGVVEQVTENLGQAYAGKYALASSALVREPLEREIALSRLMADSPTVRAWVCAEDDPVKRARALAELESYRARFSEKSWFVITNQSLHYYFDDETHGYGESKLAYTLAPEEQKDAWYFATIRDVADFAVNVNYDYVLDTYRVWINVVMRQPDGTVVGLAGTGLDLSEFLSRTVDNAESGVENIFLDHRLAIQAHRNRALIDQHSIAKSTEDLSTVERLVPKPEDLAAMEAAFRRLEEGSPAETFFVTMNGRRQIVGAAYVPSLQWYVLSFLDLKEVIGRQLFLPLVTLGFGLAVLLIVVVSMFVNLMLLAPISEITAAAKSIAEGNYSLNLKSARRDEIGTLTRAFSEMAEKVRGYAENLERLVDERTSELNETNRRLEENRDQLQEALANVKTLQGILPICSSCKKIRDDKGYWTQVESYVTEHTSAAFSHGLCPECFEKLYPQLADHDEQPPPSPRQAQGKEE